MRITLAILAIVVFAGQQAWQNCTTPQGELFPALEKGSDAIEPGSRPCGTARRQAIAASAPIATVDGADALVTGEAHPSPTVCDAVAPEGARFPPPTDYREVEPPSGLIDEAGPKYIQAVPAVAATATNPALVSVLPPPTDPLQICAQKALRGEFGSLRSWQRQAYKSAVGNRTTVQGLAWVTVYCPPTFPRGAITASGVGCSEKVAAANRIAQGKWVWVQDSPGGGATVRKVLDTGSKRNYWQARRKGADLWIDIWHPTRSNWSTVTQYAAW